MKYKAISNIDESSERRLAQIFGHAHARLLLKHGFDEGTLPHQILQDENLLRLFEREDSPVTTPQEPTPAEKAWEQVNKQHPEGVNPYAFVLGYNRAKREFEEVNKAQHDVIKTNWDKHCQIVSEYEAKIKELEEDHRRLDETWRKDYKIVHDLYDKAESRIKELESLLADKEHENQSLQSMLDQI